MNFFIPGIPAPGGSKRAFAFHKQGGKLGVRVTDAGGQRNKDWRAVVALAAREAHNADPMTGPLRVTFTFFMPRPKGHYGKRGLKPNAPYWHASRPDALKLARSTEDALTGILWGDDAQTAELRISKQYGERPGCRVLVQPALIGDTS